MNHHILLESFAFGGYKSFGTDIQEFNNLSKINLFIGKNNCGKSNILRYIHDIYPRLYKKETINIDKIDMPLSGNAQFINGYKLPLDKDSNDDYIKLRTILNNKYPLLNGNHQNTIIKLFTNKASIDKSDDVWFLFDSNMNLIMENWEKAFMNIGQRDIQLLWGKMTGMSGGSLEQHWIPDIMKRLTPTFKQLKTVLIPAIRKVDNSAISDDFDGKGIIQRLAQLQNPAVDAQHDKDKFNKINKFLQNVTDNETALIEIPHERNTILVHMDGKTLPLESLGTGIHEVIILATASTILENTAICMEEPELHLNPILQKKLMRYLLTSTHNQYFITTHSAALMDTPSATIFHICLENGVSKTYQVSSNKEKSHICEDLGYHPSDLLQTNCIIWVEGPSDRIYINYWINNLDNTLEEGIHYSIMFYGGRLASHLSGDDLEEIVNDFISLRRLNRRGIIVIDSDKEKAGNHINSTKKRLKDEFNKEPGFAWITDGREIENYINPTFIKEAITATISSAIINSNLAKYDNTLSIKRRNGKQDQASKTDVAKYIVKNKEVDFSIYDLKQQMNKVIAFIKESNPKVNT